MTKVNKCIFTGLPVQDVQSDLDAIKYYVTVKDKRFFMQLPPASKEWETNEPFFRENKYLFHALLLNNKWFDQDSSLTTIETLKQLLAQTDFPKTPQQKAENLFLQLYKLQKEDGEVVKTYHAIIEVLETLYFKSKTEVDFYLNHLENQELIKITYAQYGHIKRIDKYNITYKGLEYAIKLETEGSKSKICFVAMSFKENTEPIKKAIKAALESTGYDAKIINEQIIDSDRTINDEIIAWLKKCKFCIADFTNHSNGVYSESGFALGQGKKLFTLAAKRILTTPILILNLYNILFIKHLNS